MSRLGLGGCVLRGGGWVVNGGIWEVFYFEIFSSF